MRHVVGGSQHSPYFSLAQLVEGPLAAGFSQIFSFLGSRKSARVSQDLWQRVHRRFVGDLLGAGWEETSMLLLQLLSESSCRELAFLSSTRIAMVKGEVGVSKTSVKKKVSSQGRLPGHGPHERNFFLIADSHEVEETFLAGMHHQKIGKSERITCPPL